MVILDGHTPSKSLKKSFHFSSTWKVLANRMGLESFRIWSKTSLEVLEFQYFIIIISTMWKFCSHYVSLTTMWKFCSQYLTPQSSTLEIQFAYSIAWLLIYCYLLSTVSQGSHGFKENHWQKESWVAYWESWNNSSWTLAFQRQLRWLGHVTRMPDNWLPRRLLYGELTVGQRSVGHPKKCFIDHIKGNLLKCNIKPSDLEALASDRDIWRTVSDTGLRSFLTGWMTASEERRAARHAASTKPKTSPWCPQCNRVCASEFGLRSHMRSRIKSGNT